MENKWGHWRACVVSFLSLLTLSTLSERLIVIFRRVQDLRRRRRACASSPSPSLFAFAALTLALPSQSYWFDVDGGDAVDSLLLGNVIRCVNHDRERANVVPRSASSSLSLRIPLSAAL